MKIIIAPDSFKESMTAQEAANAIEDGIKKILPNADCIKVPMADGGEGTTQSLVDATKGVLFKKEVLGPLGNPVEAYYGILGNGTTGVLEMASASGLQLVPKNKRNPLITTTYGTGQLIKAALDHGVRHLVIGIGGSATNDGGAGMLQALGIKLLNKQGEELPFGGGYLDQLFQIDTTGIDPRLSKTVIEVACDVTNPLTGKTGASYIFGPQKGATPEMVLHLDENLKHYAKIIKAQLGKDINDIPGAGAAGGLGAGLIAFLSARLMKGVELVIQHTHLEEKLVGAGLVITGEGSIDGQTVFGKTLFGIATVAKKNGVPVIALGGSIGEGSEVLYAHGINAILGILPSTCNLDKALEKGVENLTRTSENVARMIQVFGI
ncbi:glycerate kinase family protein [Alkaliphilus transvaalensis]|uniref:glycerate kinase family protein n=1 Tax=Alkaliphilus transvaalensis TaxID=114628 RepID=UPI00047EE638|nr:glycerate kinase [Alkaliphilus transvaalensis]